MIDFSILITTKNRLEDLKITLQQILILIDRSDVECIICDDGSTDNTSEYIKKNYPNIQLIINQDSKGLIHSRNKLLSISNAKYAISLDDDAHFISIDLEEIKAFFIENPRCGVGAFRIFWGKQFPKNIISNEKIEQVKGFVGCGHIWNMKAWNSIPKYPEWFVFYGEEEFASYQLFKHNWKIYYLPSIFVHHRVNVKDRKKDNDYYLRLRRSLRAGWYLYILFYPKQLIPKRMLYSIWKQVQLKVFKGELKVLVIILQALGDVLLNLPKLFKNKNRLTLKEFEEYQSLVDSKIYWNPK